MSYRIYTTEGIILKHANFGEANLVVWVLTRDLGLIIASVQAGRTVHSKLRPAIADYSLVRLSAVRGKNGWKATNAVAERNYFFDCSNEKNRHTLAQLSSAILRLMPGESQHSEIFDLTKSGFEHLISVPEYDLPLFESLFMLRFLHLLGYVAPDIRTKNFLEKKNEWNDGILKSVVHEKKEIILTINKALESSQLV